jgi:hypothetical protein
MLRHQGAILRGFIEKKDNKSNMYWGASGTCLLYVFDSDLETCKYVKQCYRWLGQGDGGDSPTGTETRASYLSYKLMNL